MTVFTSSPTAAQAAARPVQHYCSIPPRGRDLRHFPGRNRSLAAARFARGEINETEYGDRLAVLREHAHR